MTYRLQSAKNTTIQQWFYGALSGTTRVSWNQEETFTHSDLSWSSTIIYQFPPSTTIYIIPTVQCAFLHHCPSHLWSTSGSGALHFILHTFFFTESLSSFHYTCPYCRNLFCCSTEIMSFIPSLSLISLLGAISFTLLINIIIYTCQLHHWWAYSEHILWLQSSGNTG